MNPSNQYTWDAADYARHSCAQKTWAGELIGKLQLRGHEAVLDIGCGDGKVTAQIAEFLPQGRVMGVDNSDEMIELARTTFPTAAHPNLCFQVQDARCLPFQADFDLVFSNAALHWIRNHRPLLAGVSRSLKPQGRVLMQMGGKGNARFMIEAMETLMARKEWRGYFKDFVFPYGFHDPESYRVWLDEAGLDPVRVELIPKTMTHDDRENLSGWIRTTWLPYTQRIPRCRRKAYIQQLVDRYLSDHPPDSQGQIHVDMVRLEVEARKADKP